MAGKAPAAVRCAGAVAPVALALVAPDPAKVLAALGAPRWVATDRPGALAVLPLSAAAAVAVEGRPAPASLRAC